MSHRMSAQRDAIQKPSHPVTGSTASAPTESSDPSPLEGPFRSWLAQARPWQVREADLLWHDICLLHRLRAEQDPRGSVTAWTPWQVSQAAYCLNPVQAPSYLASLALFFDHLHDTGRWTGSVVDLANCLSLSEDVAEVVLDAAERGLDEAFDDLRWTLPGGFDDADEHDALLSLDHRRKRSEDLARAIRDVQQRFAATPPQSRAG